MSGPMRLGSKASGDLDQSWCEMARTARDTYTCEPGEACQRPLHPGGIREETLASDAGCGADQPETPCPFSVIAVMERDDGKPDP